MSTVDQDSNFGHSLIQVIEDILDLQRWRFRLSFTDFDHEGTYRIIYDSQWCRVRFDFSRGYMPVHDEIHIYYGRLHAASVDLYMTWENVKCRCWHNVVETLYFLDGLSPADALEREKSGRLPAILDEFRQSERAGQLRSTPAPRYTIEREAVIWKHYGQRLFEIFDLRRPDLWDEYTRFIVKYHELKGSKPLSGYPSYDRIC